MLAEVARKALEVGRQLQPQRGGVRVQRGADGLRSWAQATQKTGRIYEEERAEIATTMEPYKWYPQRAGRVDLVMQRAKETGKIADPVIRQEIAKLMILAKTAEWTARRAR